MKKNLFLFLSCACFSFLINATNVERIVAKVGNDIITAEDLDKALKQRKLALTNNKTPAPKTSENTQLAEDILQELILQKVLEVEMKKESITITEQQVEQEYQARLKEMKLSESAFLAGLEKSGLELADYKENIKIELGRSAFIRKKIAPSLSISELDVQNEYQKNIHLFQRFNKFHFIEVVLGIDKFASKEELEKVAKEIHQKLSANQNAADLIKKYSSGAFASKGGDSDMVSAKELNPQIVNVLSSLQKGKTSPVLSTPQAFFMFKLIDKADPMPVPYGEVSYQVKNLYAEKAVIEDLKKYLTRAKQKTYVEIKR